MSPKLKKKKVRRVKAWAVIKVAGKDVMVDYDILPILKNYYLAFTGAGYVKCIIKGAANRGKGFTLHRLVMGVHKEKSSRESPIVVDHINQNKLDNRRSNLRLVDRSTSIQNRVCQKGKYQNVYFNKRTKKYYVYIKTLTDHFYKGLLTNKEVARKFAQEGRKLLYSPLLKL